MLLFSPEAEALRATLRDAFGLQSVDAGGGWLIFALPPAELGVHPDAGTGHQISFMCDDIRETIDELRSKGVRIDGEPEDRGFGIVAIMVLPGEVKVNLYQPRHALAISPQAIKAA